jgi:hypothetical protein
MSSAREHHDEAERLLALARIEQDGTRRGLILAEAQVHATLALSAPAGKGPSGPGQPETGYAAHAWPHDPGWSEDSADFEPQPDAPGRRYPPGKHPLLQPRAGEARVSGSAAPQSAPPHRPTQDHPHSLNQARAVLAKGTGRPRRPETSQPRGTETRRLQTLTAGRR